jgi:endonuclease/exonuclease/phosphatase family metal-dependent hydrolase
MKKSFGVLQLNMQFGQRWDDADPDRAPVDLDLTIAEIRGHDADIVLLQEVEQAGPGGAQPDPPLNYGRLKAALGGYDSLFSYPKADARELPFGIGLAIFSRTPLRDMMRRDLPSPPVEFEFKGEKKTPTARLMFGATSTVAGRELRVFNTHLLALFMINTRTEDYPTQRRLVIETLRGSSGPTVLGGDFNVVSHEALSQQFAAAGFTTVQTREVTWRRQPLVLDHIFYSRHLRLLRHRVQPTPASDHHALFAEFEYAG